MADTYLTNPRTGVVYQQVGSLDGYSWVRRLDDGALDTLPTAMLEVDDPTPAVGEVWESLLTGSDVVVVGFDEALTQWVTVPVMNFGWGESLAVTAYAREELAPKYKTARRRDEPKRPPVVEPTPPAAEEEAPAATDQKIEIVINERHRT